jgi:hypothetical protein
VAAAATVLVVIVAVQHVTIANDRGSASFGTLSRITPPVAAAVAGKGPVLVTGDGAQAFTSIEPGIVSALVLRGIDARVDGAEAKVFGSQHVVDGSMRVRIVIRSGADAATAPPGGRLVAMDDPSADLASGRFTNAGVSGKVELIAVYIIDG